jgi:hypothetical protein
MSTHREERQAAKRTSKRTKGKSSHISAAGLAPQAKAAWVLTFDFIDFFFFHFVLHAGGGNLREVAIGYLL